MIRYVLSVFFFVGFHASADELDGFPKGTMIIDAEVLERGSEFTGDVKVGQRIFDSINEYILKFEVVGFSLEFGVETENLRSRVEEVSYYSPVWNAKEAITSPQFVWWESNDDNSTHLLKVQSSEKFDDEITVVYTDKGERSKLTIKLK